MVSLLIIRFEINRFLTNNSIICGVTPEAVFKDLKARKFQPVYVFHGEEPYYNDQLVQYIEEHVLSADEKEFNFTLLYGADVSPEDVIVAARRFPMMADVQVTIVKEAQAMKRPGPDVFQRLVPYLENPNKTTILVLFFRGSKIAKRAVSGGDEVEKEEKPTASKGVAKVKRRSFYDAAKDHVFVESAKLREDKIPEWAAQYFQKKGFRIQARAAILLAESLGNELDKVAGEAQKLMINHALGYEFTEKDIEQLVGVSKEYSLFELQKALSTRNVLKANRIAYFMGQQEKALPIQMVLSGLLGYFAKVLQYHWLKGNASTGDIAAAMGINPYFMRDYETAARNFNPGKVIRIIHHLRDYDMRSKGWGAPQTNQGELMKELVFKIVH